MQAYRMTCSVTQGLRCCVGPTVGGFGKNTFKATLSLCAILPFQEPGPASGINVGSSAYSVCVPYTAHRRQQETTQETRSLPNLLTDTQLP
jgi:hypothetical protein